MKGKLLSALLLVLLIASSASALTYVIDHESQTPTKPLSVNQKAKYTETKITDTLPDINYNIQWQHHQRSRDYSDYLYNDDYWDDRYDRYDDGNRRTYSRYGYTTASRLSYADNYRYYDKYPDHYYNNYYSDYHRSAASYYRNRIFDTNSLVDYARYRSHNRCYKKCSDQYDPYQDRTVNSCSQTCKGPYYGYY
jgi:hypothetical protein|tara:strand:+ start:1611 stop:2192 length:582 start_codon:yes stop_codon:yes gene_type:complete